MANEGEASEYTARLERVASITVDGPLYTVENLRSMRWPDGPERRIVEWRTETFDVREITNVYFVVSWWNSLKFMAHTMMSFEFSDGRVVTPSVEIRAKIGQKYSALAGMKKTYGLTCVWSTEADAMLSRLYAEPTRLHLIEAVLTQQSAVRIFDAAVERTNELAKGDEFYHSYTNSCTSNIFDIVEQALPGNFQRRAKRILPGYVPRFLARQGALKMHGDFDETMEATLISDRAVEIGDVDDFSAQLRGRT